MPLIALPYNGFSAGFNCPFDPFELGLCAVQTSLKIQWKLSGLSIMGILEQTTPPVSAGRSVSPLAARGSIDAISSKADARRERRIDQRRLSARCRARCSLRTQKQQSGRASLCSKLLYAYGCLMLPSN